MELVNVRDLFRRQDEYVDQTIAIGGWVRNIRNSKNFGFIVVNDGTFLRGRKIKCRSSDYRYR